MKWYSRFAYFAGFAVCLAITVSVASSADDSSGVKLDVYMTNVWKGVHSETDRSAGAGGGPLPTGETRSMYFALGSYDDEGQAFASYAERVGSPSSETEEGLAKEYPHVWWIEVRKLGAEGQRMLIELTWRHTYSERRGIPIQVGGDIRQVGLEPSERHVFDFHRQSIDVEQYNSNFVFGITHKPHGRREM